MADVSVEFGATDTGLQKTLETIQQQMASLQGEVDSGTLSFQEINQKMRELRQAEGIFTKLGGELSGASKSAKEFEDQIRSAEAVTKSNRTALEIYSEEVDKLGKLLDSGLISQKTYASAIEKAEAALKAATPQTEEAKRANEELEASLKQAESETRDLADEQKKAEAITKSNRSATEIYNQEVEELQKHLAGGRISMETFEKAVAKADAKLAAANPQIEELGKDIQEAGNKSDKMGDQAGIGFGKLAAAVGVGQLAAKAFTAALDAGFAAVRGTIQGFTDALDLGGKLADLSASTGETAGNLLLLQRAFDNTGSGADAVGPALAKLQNNIFGAGEGSKEAVAAFGRMGISMEELAGKTPTQQLALVASGITSIEDPSKRAATAIDIFGKSGAQLLPLLTNFSGEMDDARATVGSLADIMDRRANVFDAVGDRFLIIQQKVRDFAAGILDKALPAIDAITSALSRIDAAAIGQRLADAFLGGQKAMNGFQAAVDAISIGQVGLAFKVFWESLKLQAMQTADSIYKNLAAAFQTAADFFGKIFSPSGALFQTAISAFDFLGNKLSATISRNLANALAGNWLTEGIALQLNTAANEANTAANKIEGSLKGAGGRIADQFKQAGKALPQSFEENYGKIPPLFDGITEQQNKVAALEAEVAAAAAKTTEERTAQAAQTDAELAKRQALKDAQAAADAEAKASKAELVTLETQVNEAKAAGNTELAKALEKELQSKKAKEEIAKLTEEYVKTLGVDANEAGRLATNFVNAKNAANSIGDRTVSVSISTKVDDTRWKDLLASIAANGDPKSVQVAMQVTGKDTLSEAYKTLQDMEAINKNYQAAFTATGAKSIEEIKANLEGIPTEAQRQLALQITGEQDFDRAVGKLEQFTGTKEAKLLLQSQGFEKMDDFQNQLNGIVGEKRTDIILKALGMDTVDEAKSALDAILANNGKQASVSVTANTNDAQKQIESLGSQPQSITLNAEKSIEDIKTRLSDSIDLALNSSKGSEILSEVKTLVSGIKDLVAKIEPRLPVAALTV